MIQKNVAVTTVVESPGQGAHTVVWNDSTKPSHGMIQWCSQVRTDSGSEDFARYVRRTHRVDRRRVRRPWRRAGLRNPSPLRARRPAESESASFRLHCRLARAASTVPTTSRRRMRRRPHFKFGCLHAHCHLCPVTGLPVD